ncbi:hypothetical protein [Kordiimonas pumila]|uniref:Alpha/beta hydrolase n=1 Tax=Kordiimonas pumila TaxID=2161677 RepID=A0ABV7D426_9PROT|nr:hypothetical protein [Kordiimonas pumila]
MSEFLKIVNNGASRTLVVFSSARVRAGKFSGTRAFTDLSSNYVYVNCPNNNWYLNPIPGLGDHPADVAERLEQELRALGSTEVITYGGSMGGYGAILYGAMVKADHCIATGVEVALGTEGAFFNKLCEETIPDDRKQLFMAAVKAAETTQFHCFYGELCAYDLWGSLQLPRQDNVHIHTIRNEDHSLPPLLNHFFGMEQFVLSCCSPGSAAPWQAMTGTITRYPDAIRALYRHDVLGERGDDIEAAFDACLLHMDGLSASILHLKRAILKRQRKDLEGAYSDIIVAVENNPDFYLALVHAANMALSIGKKEEALDFARKAQGFIIDRIRPFYQARYTLIRCLIHAGQLEEAGAELNAMKEKFAVASKKNTHWSRINELENVLTQRAARLSLQ